MDIVIPYRNSRSDELIYTLRSLQNVQHGRIYIIGNNPGLQNIVHIPAIQTSDVARNTHNILNLACRLPDISDDFIWMADDMYFMEKIDNIPVLHKGTYDELLEKYGLRNNFYINRAIKTNDHLKSLGIKSPLCYETHAPFVINKKKWRELNISAEYNKLSMYGNQCSLGGTKTEDVKVRQKDRIPNGPFASSYDVTFNTNSLGKLIREMFPERSIYEK